MFTFDYSAAKDYTQGPNALPNGDYAVNQHPSEKVIAVRGLATLAKTGSWDGLLPDGTGYAPETLKTGRFVYKDSQYPLNGNETTAMMYVHATESTDDSLIGDAPTRRLGLDSAFGLDQPCVSCVPFKRRGDLFVENTGIISIR